LDDAPSAARPLLRKVNKVGRQFFFSFFFFSFAVAVEKRRKSSFLTTNFFAQIDPRLTILLFLSVSFYDKHRCKNEATTNTDGGGSDAQQSDRGPVHRNLFRGREQQQQQFVLERGRPGGFTDAWIFVEEANEKRAKSEK
jgi:hypothetical protein